MLGTIDAIEVRYFCGESSATNTDTEGGVSGCPVGLSVYRWRRLVTVAAMQSGQGTGRAKRRHATGQIARLSKVTASLVFPLIAFRKKRGRNKILKNKQKTRVYFLSRFSVLCVCGGGGCVRACVCACVRVCVCVCVCVCV